MTPRQSSVNGVNRTTPRRTNRFWGSLLLLGLGIVGFLLIRPAQAQIDGVQRRAATQIDTDGGFRFFPRAKQAVEPAAEQGGGDAPIDDEPPEEDAVGLPAPPGPAEDDADGGAVAPEPPDNEAPPAPGGVADAPAVDDGVEDDLLPPAVAAEEEEGAAPEEEEEAAAPVAPVKKPKAAPVVEAGNDDGEDAIAAGPDDEDDGEVAPAVGKKPKKAPKVVEDDDVADGPADDEGDDLDEEADAAEDEEEDAPDAVLDDDVGDEDVAPGVPKGKPKAPKVPDIIDEATDDDAEDDDVRVVKTNKKPKKRTPTKKRPSYDPTAAAHWKEVPAVKVTVNAYEDEDGAVCSRDSPSCNLRAAFVFVGNRQGTIYLPTMEVHKLKKGPIMVPMYSHITLTSVGTTAQKKAVIYHRESSTFGGGTSAVLVVPENTTLTLDAVTFKNNPRRAVYGDRGADISVLNCAFVNNTFDSDGGVFRVDGGNLDIKQSLFFNNTDWSNGGAIYTTYSNLTIAGTNFLNNSASSGASLKTYQSIVNISGSHFGGGTAWSDGGAMELVESMGDVYDNIMELNTASSGGCVKVIGSNVTFFGIEFRKNSCKNTGAVFDAYLSNTTIKACTFRRNWAKNVGGCLSGYQSQYNTYQCTFEFNKAEAGGGVVSLLEAELYEFESTFQNNTAFMGGVVNVEEDGYAHLKDSLLRGNIGTGNGAAVRINDAHAYLENVFAINNTVIAEDGGAAIFGEGGFLDTYLGVFTNHTSEAGPVVHVINTTTSLNSSTFRFNEAVSLGGALWIQNSEFVAWNTTFLRNCAQKGGAVLIQNEITEEDLEVPRFTPRRIQFVESFFLENIASEAGGAIEMSLAENVTTLHGAFLNNNATEFGGAVHMESSNATFVGTRFEGNFARFGAAIETFVSEFRTLNCIIEKNRASWGGALEFKMSTFKCDGSTFSKNQAKYDGGALNCQNSSLKVDECVIRGNLGANNAGGFWLESSNMTATGSTFDSNVAEARDGGGVFSYNTDSKFRGCVFGSNSARKGPDLYNHGGLAEVFCAHIGRVYNKPKVGGHVTQDCFTCPNGQYGDYASAGSLVCEQECDVTATAMSCYECPNGWACDGARDCKAGYRGEQCMGCKGGWVKIDGQCQPIAAMAIVVVIGIFTLGAFVWYLLRGPVLDANQFTRVKIVWSLLQLLVMIGLIRNAFGRAVPFFLGVLKPVALWFDLSTIGSLSKHSFPGVHVCNLLFPVLIFLGLVKAQDVLYQRRMHALRQSLMEDALEWLKHERRVGQFTLLFAELAYAPILYQAAKAFHCYDTAHGPALVWEPSMQCGGTAGQFVLRGLSVIAIVVVGLVLPLVLRYIVVTLNQQNRLFHPATREMYKALYESYLEDRLFYDLVLLGFRAALLLPLLAFRSGFVQAMVMLAATGLYYFYYRGNSPFIKFEDQGDLEHPNLHYRAEESKVGVVTFWLVAAAIGCKSEDMVEVCGWMFVVLNFFVLAFVFRNLALGIQNVNQEPDASEVLALRDELLSDPSIDKGHPNDHLFTQEGWRGFLHSFLTFETSSPFTPSSFRATNAQSPKAGGWMSAFLSPAQRVLARLMGREGGAREGEEGRTAGEVEKAPRKSAVTGQVDSGVAITIGATPRMQGGERKLSATARTPRSVKTPKTSGSQRSMKTPRTPGSHRGRKRLTRQAVAESVTKEMQGFFGFFRRGGSKVEEEEKKEEEARRKKRREKKEEEGEEGEARKRKEKKERKERRGTKEGGEGAEGGMDESEAGKKKKKKKSKRKDKDVLGESSTEKIDEEGEAATEAMAVDEAPLSVEVTAVVDVPLSPTAVVVDLAPSTDMEEEKNAEP